MPSLLERLREALAPRYEVEGEVATGGMATVFRALDTSLDRVVAIKVLRPDMATATGEARFLREARTLASFSHPNMVAIHDAAQHDGLSYYVMDLIEGETLQQRLSRGPLDNRDAFRLGRDLLQALERIHRAGVVHRDIKPSNVFLVDGRALLADFGIVHVVEPVDETLTSEGRGPGTPAYMSPEQAKGEVPLPASDLYSLGMVLYEALTGKRWMTMAALESGDWSRVPAASRPMLKRALAVDPAERWKSAAEFRDALRTRGPWLRIPRWLALVVVVAIAALVWWALDRPGMPAPAPPETVIRDVAVFPCEAAEAADSTLGANIGRYVSANLEVIPGITRVPFPTTASLYDARAGILDPADWTEALGARQAAVCSMNRETDGVVINLRLLGETGEQLYFERVLVEGSSDAELLRRAASLVSAHIVLKLSDLTMTDEEIDRFAEVPFDALSHYLSGQDALRRGAWKSAEEQYDEAIEADSSFTLAHLRLAEVRRWMADRPIDAALSEILEMDLASLGPLDSLLLEACATPHGRAQLLAFESILALPEYHLDAYATLLYADELYHRGSLWGVPLDSAVAMLERAVSRDSFLVPAVEHLTQALIRTGREEDAAATLAHLRRIHAAPGESDLYYPDVWKWGFAERFHPDTARAIRESMEGVQLRELGLYARWVRYIDSPSTQAALGEMLVTAADRLGSPHFAAQGFVDRGLGLIAQGLVGEGVSSFDSAARRLATPETITQAAEWSVIPYALGVDGFSSADAERGQRALEAMWGRRDANDPIRARAATALALLADSRGDEGAREKWVARLDSLGSRIGPGALRPLRLTSALASASRGEYRRALDLTAEDLAYDSAGLADRPFLRSALYLKRGDWYEEMGMPDSARASWLWHENTDLEGTVPPEQVQAGEVDGALGSHALRRISRVRDEVPE
jgi:tetratricopeptide (TPR) repeat protein